jgi:nucleoid DNA-binding protein
MKTEELNKQVVDVLGTDSEDAVQMVTGAFEVAIVHQLLEPGGHVELENLGTFDNQDGAIVFRPSAFLTSAAQVVRKR